MHAPVWLLTVDRIQCSEVFASYSLFIDRHQQLSPFFNPIYLHLHAVHLTKKPLLCFYSIDYMPAVDFRHKSHFLSIKSRTEAGGGGTRSMDERLRESRVNDAFGRLLRSIIPNDDWHRCNKSRILRTSFRNRGRPAASLENL